MKKRLPEIDMVRGITILLVVLGHAQIPNEDLSQVLQIFRMPLFFLISGYLFSELKYLFNVNLLIKNKIRSLIIPYFSACFIFYVLFIVKTTGSRESIFDWYAPLFGVVYGNWLDINPPLWFLVCLFCIFLIYVFVLRYINPYPFKIKLFVFLILGLLGFLIGKTIYLPWNIDIALVSLVFFYLGNQIKQSQLLIKTASHKYFFAFSLIGLIISFIYNTEVIVNDRMYGNIFLFYLGGLSGSILVILITKYFLSKVYLIRKLLSYLGKESSVILIFHMGLGFPLLKVVDIILSTNFYSNWIALTIFSIFVSLIIGFSIRKIPILNFLLNGRKLI